MEQRPALVCQDVEKRFGATLAVSGVGFTLQPGEVLALVGENGAGKSTLMNMLSGVLQPDTGSITLAEPSGALQRGVAMVHQELSLFGNLTVAENLALDEGSARGTAAVREAARRAVEELGADIDVDATVSDLTVGQRQLVEVAKAISRPPVLLILDEPTSSLEGPQVELLFAAVRRLAAAGTAVIFVSHRMPELFELCDRLLVLRDGRQVETGPLAGHDTDSLVASMVGREADGVYPERRTGAAPAGPVRAEGLTFGDVVRGVDLDLPAGRITAIAGLDGHGQSELAELLVGARTPTGGRILVDGRAARLRSPHDAVRRGIGYIPADRRLDGLLLDKSIAQNATLAAGPRLERSGLHRPSRERRLVDAVATRLSVRRSSVNQPAQELSGGNQQKVLVARWLLADDLRLLVLNDPTRGVDVGSRAQIYEAIDELLERGVAVVLVSTDLQEILGLADTIHVMYTGRITGTLEGRDATEDSVMRLAVGGTP